MLATSPPEPRYFGPVRFYPGALWPSFAGHVVRLFSTGGVQVDAIDVGDGWLGVDVSSEGRVALRDAWATSDVLVAGPDGALLSSRPTAWCPAGPEYDLRVVGNGEVWVSVECGSYMRRHDPAGALLVQTPVPGGTGSIWDDSSDDFDVAPDGTIRVWQGYPPSTVPRMDGGRRRRHVVHVPRGRLGHRLRRGRFGLDMFPARWRDPRRRPERSAPGDRHLAAHVGGVVVRSARGR